MELLSQYTTPEEMLSVSSQQPAEVLEKASRGRLGTEKAVEIQDAANHACCAGNKESAEKQEARIISY